MLQNLKKQAPVIDDINVEGCYNLVNQRNAMKPTITDGTRAVDNAEAPPGRMSIVRRSITMDDINKMRQTLFPDDVQGQPRKMKIGDR